MSVPTKPAEKPTWPALRLSLADWPGVTWPLALAHGLIRQGRTEWFGNPLHLALLSWPRIEGFTAAPRDLRPTDAKKGRDLLAGRFDLAGDPLSLGAAADPWNRASPTRRFAVALHRFAWLPDLLTQGEAGMMEALRLVGGWHEVFGRWNPFAWSGEVLDRRTFNLACAASMLARQASAVERPVLAGILARHVRQCLQTAEPATRRGQRLVAAAVGACALDGPVADRLLTRALARLERTLPAEVLSDGGHVSRSPEAGLELLLDLMSLDDALSQRGMERPVEVGRAIDRLCAGLRFLTLPDGRLPCFQGGEAGDPRTLATARAYDDEAAAIPSAMPHSGYQRLDNGLIQVLVDAGPPARGALSTTATAQTLAMEISFDGERLISGAGWSPRAPGQQAQRLTSAGATASLGAGSAGSPLSGLRAVLMGARLVGGARELGVRCERSDAGQWLQASHDGWLADLGLIHERRLYLDRVTHQLRGEDRFEPKAAPAGRLLAYAVHFPLFPGATASLARDNRSVLLRTPSQAGIWLRNDATDVRIEPTIHFIDGQAKPTQQVVLRGHFHADKGGRVRWKLVPAEV